MSYLNISRHIYIFISRCIQHALEFRRYVFLSEAREQAPDHIYLLSFAITLPLICGVNSVSHDYMKYSSTGSEYHNDSRVMAYLNISHIDIFRAFNRLLIYDTLPDELLFPTSAYWIHVFCALLRIPFSVWILSSFLLHGHEHLLQSYDHTFSSLNQPFFSPKHDFATLT